MVLDILMSKLTELQELVDYRRQLINKDELEMINIKEAIAELQFLESTREKGSFHEKMDQH